MSEPRPTATPGTLGGVLREERAKRHWSLRQAERETGVHNAHLTQIENGTIAKPDHNTLFALATTYGVPFERLLELAGHVERGGQPPRRSPYGAVAWKALSSLDADEQRQVVDFIARLHRHRRVSRDGQ